MEDEKYAIVDGVLWLKNKELVNLWITDPRHRFSNISMLSLSPALQELQFTPEADLDLSPLLELPSLHTLVLFDGVDVSSLAEHPRLSAVRILYSSLPIGFEALATLPKLENLELQTKHIVQTSTPRHFPIKSFYGHPSLKALFLDKPFTLPYDTDLTQLPALNRVTYIGNDLSTKTMVARFKEAKKARKRV